MCVRRNVRMGDTIPGSRRRLWRSTRHVPSECPGRSVRTRHYPRRRCQYDAIDDFRSGRRDSPRFRDSWMSHRRRIGATYDRSGTWGRSDRRRCFRRRPQALRMRPPFPFFFFRFFRRHREKGPGEHFFRLRFLLLRRILWVVVATGGAVVVLCGTATGGRGDDTISKFWGRKWGRVSTGIVIN